MSRRFGSPGPYDADDASRRKKKRYLSRSDEEIREEMDSRRLSYRRGWPALDNLPLQTVSDGAKEHIDSANSRLEEVGNILQSHNISPGQARFAFRVPYEHSDEVPSTDLTQFLTLVVSADFLESLDRIERVIVRIRAMFRSYSSTESVKIEVLDFRALHKIPTYPIRHTEVNVLAQWEKVGLELMALLKNEKWLAVELSRQGLHGDPTQCVPTVVIASQKADDISWYHSMISAVRDILANHPIRFDVEIMTSKSLLGARRRPPPSHPVGMSSYDKTVAMGASMGISNDDGGSATLGGVVILANGVRCGITNWHCVLDEGGKVAAVMEKQKQGFLPPNNPTMNAMPMHITTPSNQDHNAFLDRLRSKIQVHQKAVSRGVSESKVYLKESEAEAQQCQKVTRRFGMTIAGSGYRVEMYPKYATHTSGSAKGKGKASSETLYRTPLDWALVHIKDPGTRNMTNFLPRNELPTEPSSELVPGQACDRWSVFDVQREDVRVAKLGRTSGWTFGEINTALLFINPEEDDDVSSKFGLTTKEPGRCFGVLNRIADRDFVEKGDSGSIAVHDGSGVWLGLLYGVGPYGHGYMIPMDIIFKDIKKVTGQEISCPQFVSPELVGLARYQLG